MTGTSDALRAPYKLFDYYEFKDRNLFFGREEEVLQTVGEILSTRLLVLFAPSGSGKSSLINAGVRPKLEERGFATVSVRLDRAPDLAITHCLRETLPELFSGLSDEADLLSSLRAAYTPRDGQPAPKPLVMFLDQFEEFFIIFRDKPNLRRAFAKQIAEIKFDTSLPVYVVLSLRDDYFVNLNEFREEIPSIFHNNANIQLRPLNDEAALRAIIEPAKQVGLRFEEGLPEQIVRDLKELQARTISQRSGQADPTPGSHNGTSARRQPDQQTGSDRKAPPAEDRPNGSVLPITLQIVCYNLWLKRPCDGQPITRQFYGSTGLGGAAAIVQNQIDESLAQIPRSQHQLMRRLFRALMTPDLTKRLRPAEDLAAMLQIRNPRKLTALLEQLTRVNIVRVEHIETRPWYEFRHDYLVGKIAAWLDRMDDRDRWWRWVIATSILVSMPMLIWAGRQAFKFESLVVRTYPSMSDLVIERTWNPFNLQIEMGLSDYSIDKHSDDFGRLARGGIPLPFAQATDWTNLSGLIATAQRGTFRLRALNDPEGIRLMLLAADVGQVVDAAKVEPTLLAKLLALLNDNDESVRHGAAAALGQLGNGDVAVVDNLVVSLRDNDVGVRERAATALGHLASRDATVVVRVVALLKDSDVNVRQNAATILGQTGQGDPAVIAALAGLLTARDPYVRRSAVIALGNLGKGNTGVVGELVAGLGDNDPIVRQSAATALGQLGNGDVTVVEGLVAVLKDPESDVRQGATTSLGQLGNKDATVIAALLDLLKKDQEPNVRGSAATALGQLGQGDATVIEALLASLMDPSADVRRRAATALGEVGQGATTIANGLLHSLGDTASPVRQSAASALGQLGKEDPRVGMRLVALLRDSDANVRRSAAMALGQVGTADAAVVEGVVTALQDIDENVRGSAAAALGQLRTGDAAVIAAMVASLRDNEPYVRASAAAALGQLGQADTAVLTALQASLGDPIAYVRASAVTALGKLGAGDTVTVDRLVALLTDDNSTVQDSAAAALAELGQKRADWTDARLLELLQDDLSALRRAAGLVLANRPTLQPDTYAKINRLREDARPWVRLAGWDTLVRIEKARPTGTEMKQGHA